MFKWRYMIGDLEVGSISDPIWQGPEGQPLALEGPNTIEELDSERVDMARYASILPVDPDLFVTLGAGMTPLIDGVLAGRPVKFKLDSLLPTGSFKDRGAAVSVAHLRQIGTRRIVIDSSGNAAASMSAFCAAHGIECVVYAPATASPGKLVQSAAYGSQVVLVEGAREDVATAAQDAATASDDVSYVSHNWSPVFAEGVKTWAIEVWEQLDRQLPRRVFVPTGGGSALAGAHRGFAATGGMPALIACQPAACAPVALAASAGAASVTGVQPQSTIAEGARISDPPRDSMLLDAISDSDGWASAITEEQIRAACLALWRQGIYAEPTAALGAAAFIQAVSSGVDLDGISVVLITGSGLKATETVQQILEED
ncbi:MAG: pyridoxal-phosphate dependent enzyme [Thermomicrobiales bacterium]